MANKPVEVFVVLATGPELPTPGPLVVGVYADPVEAEKAKEAYFYDHVAMVTILTGEYHPPKKKGR
jgi:hypothetical protein